MPATGGAITVLVDAQVYPAFLAVDEANVYTLSTPINGQEEGGQLFRIPKSGGPQSLLSEPGKGAIVADVVALEMVDRDAQTLARAQPPGQHAPVTGDLHFDGRAEKAKNSQRQAKPGTRSTSP